MKQINIDVQSPVISDSKQNARFNDPLLTGVKSLLDCQDLHIDLNSLRYGAPVQDGRVPVDELPALLSRHGIAARIAPLPLSQIGATLLPCLLFTNDGHSLVLTGFDGDDCLLRSPVSGGEIRKSQQDLNALYTGQALFAHARGHDHHRAGNYAATPGAHWFRSRIIAQWQSFAEVALASLLAALLSVATALFAMQVYDRVVPTEATETLWALAIGVFIAIFFEFLLRSLRAQLIESSGKRLDLELSQHLFQQVISLKLAAKPGSTGAFASQIRDFESVREFFTASTLGACGDLPFTLLFLGLIAIIAGPLAFIPLIAIVAMLTPSFLAQPMVSRLAREGLRENAVRNAVLLETVDQLESVKANRGEGRLLGLWQRLTSEQTSRAVSARHLAAWLNGWSVVMQQCGYVGAIIAGVYLIFSGDLTIGGLIACSILTTRSITPMVQANNLLARWQQVKVALEGLEELMQRPTERPQNRRFVKLQQTQGEYLIENVGWRYSEESEQVLALDKWRIESGQHWVLLGGNGAGKSTLLRLLAGLYDTPTGSLRLDNLEMSQIDPADKRRFIGYMPQDIALFNGTLRDNLTLDGGHYEDAQLLAALDKAGMGEFVRRHPMGLDMFISGTNGMSGGQRQSVGLARLLLLDPPIVLLDEPTAALDQNTENAVIAMLQPWLRGRTVVLATHKRPLLALADHALVLKDGQRVLSDTLQSVLQRTGNAAQSGNN